MTRKYSNGEVVIVWKPELCVHSGICARGLPDVFDPKRRPWVDASAATTQEIIDQVRKCPSGALTVEPNDSSGPEAPIRL
jgi:uncharacterized Fe-S cluster protein YjdI